MTSHARLKAPAHITEPRTKTVPYRWTHHGQTLQDDYAWLRDPGYPEVSDPVILEQLSAENTYFDTVMAEQEGLISALEAEIKGRMKEDDESVPWSDGPYDFRWSFSAGSEYRLWSLRPRGSEAWATLFDEATAADGLDYFRLRALEVSPDGRWCASATDTSGGERYTVQVFDINTRETLDIEVSGTSGELVWSADSKGFFYVELSQEWRPFRVWYQALSGAPARTVYEEEDDQFFVHIHATEPKCHLVITSGTHITSENHLVPLQDPAAPPRCVLPRRDGHDYSVSAWGEAGWVVRSNRDQVNFDLFLVKDIFGQEDDWSPIRAGNERRYIRGVMLQKNRMLVFESNDGRMDMVLVEPTALEGRTVAFPEESRSLGFGVNVEFEAPHIRLHYSSLTRPQTIYDLNPDTLALTTRKVTEIPSGYSSDDYVSERLIIPVRDGARVPVSLVYKKGWERGGDSPLHLYGYGAYGLGMSPDFSANRISLLDRGFAYAIAHIRGGDELGYPWYQAGKLERRENTFNDFVDVTKALIEEGFVKEQRITISGGSAGGELMGAVVNAAGDLYAAAVLHVPFVDVLNTMMDASLPLTPMEWPEWGNPIKDKAAFRTIKRYCPYTNIEAMAYPPMMITGGLNDPRVTYWEPAKWTAKVRAHKTDDNLVMMKMNMGAGHGGKSGRYTRVREIAEEYAFCLMAVGAA